MPPPQPFPLSVTLVPILPSKPLHSKSNRVAEIINFFFLLGVRHQADQIPYLAFHMATQAPTPTESVEWTSIKRKKERRRYQQKCCRFITDYKKNEACNHRLRFKHHMIQTLPSHFTKRNAIHSFWEKLWSLPGKSHQPPCWCSKAGNFQKFLKQKSHDFLIQLNYFKLKVTQLYARGPNKVWKCFLHSNKCFLWSCTHGNSPIATSRSHLQEQE